MSKDADRIREELDRVRLHSQPLSPAEEHLLIICRMLVNYIENIGKRSYITPADYNDLTPADDSSE